MHLWKKKFNYIIVSSLYHSIGLIFLPIYLFIKKWKYQGILVAYILGILIYIFEIDLLKLSFYWINKIPLKLITYKVYYYTTSYYNQEVIRYGLTLGFYLRFFLIVSSFFFIRNQNTALKMIILGNLFTLYFNNYPIFIERIVNICYLFEIFLIPNLLKNTKKILLIIILLVYTGLFYGKILMSREREGNYQYLPYITIFEKRSS